MIVAEIADDEKAIVRRDGGAVRVRSVLTFMVRTGSAKLLMIFEVKALDGLTEAAVRQYAEGRDTAAGVLGGEYSMAGRVDRDVARAGKAGRDLA